MQLQGFNKYPAATRKAAPKQRKLIVPLDKNNRGSHHGLNIDLRLEFTSAE